MPTLVQPGCPSNLESYDGGCRAGLFSLDLAYALEFKARFRQAWVEGVCRVQDPEDGSDFASDRLGSQGLGFFPRHPELPTPKPKALQQSSHGHELREGMSTKPVEINP